MKLGEWTKKNSGIDQDLRENFGEIVGNDPINMMILPTKMMTSLKMLDLTKTHEALIKSGGQTKIMKKFHHESRDFNSQQGTQVA